MALLTRPKDNRSLPYLLKSGHFTIFLEEASWANEDFTRLESVMFGFFNSDLALSPMRRFPF